MELIDKHKLARAALEKNSEIFDVHVAVLKALEPNIHPSRALLLAALQQDKAATEIPPEYADYIDVFSPDLAIKLPKNTGINKHAIKLKEGKQPPYWPIYSLSPLELETLKTSIETHLKTEFIFPSKSPTSAPIFFDKKFNGSLCLCVDYWGLNNLII